VPAGQCRAAFGRTSLCFLVQTDAGRISAGRWPLLAAWLRSSALPVFAVLAVLVALRYGAVIGWLHELERSAAAAIDASVPRLDAEPAVRPRRARTGSATPRSLFGLAFESRPPP